MRLEVLRSESCGGGTCPTLYATDRGTFVVQGYILDGETLREMGLPEGEAAVEIPRSLFGGDGGGSGGALN